jgi:hypothetical protein
VAVWKGFRVGKRNFEIDLVEFFANMLDGESFERAHHAPPGRELQLPLTPKGYGLKPLSAQFLPEVFRERVEIDVFNAAVKPVVMSPFSHSLGFTHMDPVGGLVAGSPEAVPFHKGFKQVDREMVDPEPILRDSFGIEGEELGGQAFDGNPGQDEKAGVVSHHGEVFHFCHRVPADELFSAPDPPGGRPPSQTGHRSFPEKSHIFEMAAHDLPVAKIMVPIEEAGIEGLESRVANEMEPERSEVPQFSRHRRLVNFHRKDATVAFVVVGTGNARGKRDEAFAVQGQKDFPAGHVFETAAGLDPAPLAAQDPGDPGAPLSPVLFHHGLNLGDIRPCHGSFSDRQRFHNHRIAEQRRGRHSKVALAAKCFRPDETP